MGIVLLQNLQVQLGFLEQAVFIGCDAKLDGLFKVPVHLVFFDGYPGRLAAMFGIGGMWQVPFHIARAGDQGHVVQIDDLGHRE